MNCPIGLDDTPELCSAGTCDECLLRRSKHKYDHELFIHTHNYNDYKRFCDERGINTKSAIYVQNVGDLRGFDGTKHILIITGLANEFTYELVHMAESRGFTIKEME